jgi:O-Antigen ligase
MDIDQRHDADMSPDAPSTVGPRQWVLAAAVFGLMIAEGYRHGGFWPSDALLVAVASFVVLCVSVVLVPPDRRSMLLVGSVVALALWWFIRSVGVGTPKAFLPLGASVLAFGAAFVAVRPLTGRLRELAGLGVACLGAAGALIGFAGLVWRHYPLAIPTQALWRLSTTLTYSDAAGLALGMCLLVAMGVKTCPTLARATVCLCAGGFVASQSRGAYVAFAFACLLVPWRRYAALAVPLGAGLVLGVAAIVTSPETTPVPWLAAAVAITCAVSVITRWDATSFRVTPVARLVLVVAALALVSALVVGLHREIGLRALAPSDQDRASEWSAAWHQWWSAPLLGVGPDRLLTFQASDGSFAHFAHNEYLQIAADAGVVGLTLLGAVGASVARTVRRSDLRSTCAVSALVCLAIGGAFDFDWHLSWIGLLGGWCAGLAARQGRVARETCSRSSVRATSLAR